MKKAQRYLDCGVSQAWFYRKTSAPSWAREQFRSDLIPGFSIRIGDLFDHI